MSFEPLLKSSDVISSNRQDVIGEIVSHLVVAIIIGGIIVWQIGSTESEPDLGLLGIAAFLGYLIYRAIQGRQKLANKEDILWRANASTLRAQRSDGVWDTFCIDDVVHVLPPDNGYILAIIGQQNVFLECEGDDKDRAIQFWTAVGRRFPYYGYVPVTRKTPNHSMVGCRDCAAVYPMLRVTNWTRYRGDVWDFFRMQHDAVCPECRAGFVLYAKVSDRPMSQSGIAAYRDVIARAEAQQG